MSTLDLFKLDGKVALVTGCKRGIGKAMALALAEAGADIVGVSASLELAGSEIENEISALGRNFRAYQCDFSDRQADAGPRWEELAKLPMERLEAGFAKPHDFMPDFPKLSDDDVADLLAYIQSIK